MQSVAGFFLSRLPDCGTVEGDGEEPPRYQFLATVQSWVDWLKMPYPEVEKKFRRSEMALLSWRGREQSVQMSRKFQGQQNQMRAQMDALRAQATTQAASFPEPEDVAGEVPEEYITNGELDLSKMPSEMALRYMRSLGFSMAALGPEPAPKAPQKPPTVPAGPTK